MVRTLWRGLAVALVPWGIVVAAPALPTAGTGWSVALEVDGADPMLRVRLPAGDQPVAERLLGRLEESVERARQAGYRVVVCLSGTGSVPPSIQGGAPAPLTAGWLDLVRRAGERLAGRVELYEIWERPDQAASWGAEPSPRAYAYLFKRAAVALRSADPAALVSLGSLSGDARVFLEDLFGLEVAPYADALGLAGSPEDLPEAVTALQALVARHDPGLRVWFPAIPAEGGAMGTARRFAAAVQRGAALTLFEAAGVGGPAAAALRALAARVPPAAAAVPSQPGVGSLLLAEDAGDPVGEVVALFDAERSRGIVLYVPDGSQPAALATLVVDTADITDPQLLTFDDLREEPVDFFIPDRRTDTTRLQVPTGRGPGLLSFRRFAAGDRSPPDAVQVAGTAGMSVEEIIARHQEAQAAQDAVLERYLAEAQVDLHFQVGASGSLDVTLVHTFFFERGRPAEWELRELYFNGVRWRGKRVPEIPLVQPDKIVLLPLEIHLDRSYRYRLEGADQVAGRPAWRVAFEPAAPDAALYRGSIWIDQERFVRLQLALRQQGMEPPFVASDETDRFVPVIAPDGTELWLLAGSNGTQLYSAVGRTFAVNRQVRFSGFRVNPEEFAARRQAAYESRNPILRDTDAGFRYLRRTADGDRVLEEEMSRDQLFWLAGAFQDGSVDSPVPYAGIDYFSFDLAGSGTQANLFFAGALLSASFSGTGLGGSRLEAGGDLFAVAFDSTDRLFVQGEEQELQNVDRKTQSLDGFLAVPFAAYWRFRAGVGVEWDNFSRDRETDASFVTPVDTFVYSGTLGLNFNRRGWTVAAHAAAFLRDQWEPWGLAEDQAAFRSSQRGYLAWGAEVNREIFLPWFQKITVGIEWDAGSDMDRFSRFRVGFFSNRVRGFAGSGLRYERGGIGRVQYAFDLARVVRFDIGLDHARLKDSAESDAYRDHTGVGVSGSFMGPWGTILNLDWGYGLRSDIPDLEGEHEFRLLVLKLF